MNIKNKQNYTPVIIAVSIVVGIIIGSFFANHYSNNRLSLSGSNNSKISDLLSIIDEKYVDSVDVDSLIDKTLSHILAELDPHSTYTTAKEVELEMQGLKGSFSGIGVIFSIMDDTARVIKVVADGPSENSGLQAGDRIVQVDGKSFVGNFLTDEYAMNHLRGPENSIVKIGVLRSGVKGIQTYNIKRGAVPVKTISTYAMLDQNTGYVKISSFGDKTYDELLYALTTLHCKNLIVDLRGNGGGYLDAALKIANEFLPANRLIVYTEGRKSEKKEYRSNGRGTYQNMPLVVLTDETSASASEIFAAAMQDNDRATIVGRRTFGKGLVQEPITFSDNSLVKLTVARYYSPSGRCLQKHYIKGENEKYLDDLMERFKRGEFTSRDSIHLDGQKFYTLNGRTVYGGAGVVPDEFIPADTTQNNEYTKEAFGKKLVPMFGYKYADNHRKQYSAMKWQDLSSMLKKEDLVSKFAVYAAAKGLPQNAFRIRQAHSFLEKAIIQYILDYTLGEEAANLYYNQTDNCVKKAMQLINENKTFPQGPASKKPTKTKEKPKTALVVTATYQNMA